MKYWMLIVFSLTLQGLYAQGSVSDKKKQAKEYIFHDRYADALAVLTASRQAIRDDKEAQLLLAICYFQLNELDKASEILKPLASSERPELPECLLYMAKLYHSQHQFAEASNYYKLYLRQIRKDHAHRKMVIEEIRRCANGLEWQYQTSQIVVENLGRQVNTAYDEFAPIPSPNNSDRLYFSSARQGNMGGLRNRFGATDEKLGHYFSDMFGCMLNEGNWGNVEQLHYLLNSPRHEVLLDFNKDGNVLYYAKGWDYNNGEVIVDTFKRLEDRTLSSTPFQSQVNSVAGDGQLYFYNDTTLLFTSRRQGGQGGLDIYKSIFRKGRWSTPENLGPGVNTPFDETTPFMAADGRTLYFSSNDSKKSIGGLDIFKSVYNARSKTWTDPVSLGLPVNSAGDDAYFRVAKDGFTAFLSSSRRDGMGMRDIYMVYFPNYLPEMDPPPVVAVQVAPATPAKVDPPAYTQPAFPPVYLGLNDAFSDKETNTLDQIAQLLLQYPSLTLVITAYPPQGSTGGKGAYLAVQHAEKVSDFLLKKGVSPEAIYMRGIGKPASQSKSAVVEFAFKGAADLPIKGKVPVIGDYYNSVAPGLTTNKDLFYKVQVASSKGEYANPQAASLPDIMTEKTPHFEFYRYTLGAFERHADAVQFKNQLLAKGFSGAFIVPFLNGVRADKNKVKQAVSLFPDLQNYLGQ